MMPCRDYETCGHLPHNLCTAPEYRDIAITSCRKFCGFCSGKIITEFIVYGLLKMSKYIFRGLDYVRIRCMSYKNKELFIIR